MRRRILAAVLTALALVGLTATHADAARPAARTVTFQLTADATLAPYADQVAAIWNGSNTGVSVVVVADCAGAYCIHAYVADIGYAGLSDRNTDGSYYAQVGDWVVDLYGGDAVVHTMAHEVGHGIIGTLGGGQWHASDPRDLMTATHNPRDPIGRITRETKQYLAPLCA